MIDIRLQTEYEQVAGPVQFTLRSIPPDKVPEVEDMMRAVIAGERSPITDKDLGISIPVEADS